LASKKQVNPSVYIQRWGGLPHLIMLYEVSIQGRNSAHPCSCSGAVSEY
jgi:hypothetical protein